jgi:hypothetical protein
MSQMTTTADADLRRQSRRLRNGATVAFGLIVLLILFPYAAAATQVIQGPERFGAAVRFFGWGLAATLAAGFYLWALWSVRQVFHTVAEGALFGPAIAAGVQRVGLALACGSLVSLVGDPNLRRWAMEAGLLPGRPRPFQGVLHYDAAYVAVGVVGLSLMLLGRMLVRAAEAEAQAKALRAELDEFL